MHIAQSSRNGLSVTFEKHTKIIEDGKEHVFVTQKAGSEESQPRARKKGGDPAIRPCHFPSKIILIIFGVIL
jgi:hypothetical protein